jgi:hypothetical protein
MEPRKITLILWFLTVLFFILWVFNKQTAIFYGMFFLTPLWGIWIFKNPEWRKN